MATSKRFWQNEKIYQKVEWSKTRFDKLAEKFENVQDNDVVIVAGSEDFIDRINRLLINFHTNFTLVDCFNIHDIAKDKNFRISDFSQILNTKGLEKIEDFNLV